MTDKVRKYLTFCLILICWLPQINYLIPVPNIKVAEQIHSFAMESFDKSPQVVQKGILDPKDYELDKIYRNLWSHWLFKAFMVAFGIISGLLMYSNFFMWPLFTISSSVLYLYIWYFSGSTASAPIFQSYKLKLKLADIHGHHITFLYKDLILPLLFTIIVILTISFLIIPKGRKQ